MSLRIKWVADLSSWEGFSYVKLKNVPMKLTSKGEVIDFDELKIKQLVARAIILSQTPINGRELKLLRSVVGLSMNKFAWALGISYGAIFHWEKNHNRQLNIINEVAVRLLCAELLGLQITGEFSKLQGRPSSAPLEIQISRKKLRARFPRKKTITRRSYRGEREIQVIADKND